jgi:hypothetical protein
MWPTVHAGKRFVNEGEVCFARVFTTGRHIVHDELWIIRFPHLRDWRSAKNASWTMQECQENGPSARSQGRDHRCSPRCTGVAQFHVRRPKRLRSLDWVVIGSSPQRSVIGGLRRTVVGWRGPSHRHRVCEVWPERHALSRDISRQATGRTKEPLLNARRVFTAMQLKGRLEEWGAELYPRMIVRDVERSAKLMVVGGPRRVRDLRDGILIPTPPMTTTHAKRGICFRCV